MRNFFIVVAATCALAIAFAAKAEIPITATITGENTALNVAVSIPVPASFQYGQSYIWFAVAQNGQLYFNNGNEFTPYAGGDAPPFTQGTYGPTANVTISSWNTGNNTADLYFGIGRTFYEMVNGQLYKKIGSIAPLYDYSGYWKSPELGLTYSVYQSGRNIKVVDYIANRSSFTAILCFGGCASNYNYSGTIGADNVSATIAGYEIDSGYNRLPSMVMNITMTSSSSGKVMLMACQNSTKYVCATSVGSVWTVNKIGNLAP